VERGEIKRLMIFMPPGHAKSDLATRYFTAWYMGRRPTENVMICSYAATLASDDFGGKVKQIVASPLHRSIFPECVVTRESFSKTQFRTTRNGTFYSVGFSGGVIGKRVNLIVLDDLIKNDQEADSEVVQDRLFKNYGSVIKSRLRPGGKVVFCIHRWRPRDIAGRILEIEGQVANGGDWTVLTLPAEDPPDSGEYLWAEHYSAKHYEEAKKFEDSWESMWQQNPQGSKSLWFKDQYLQFYDIAPPKGKFNTYMVVDPAISKDRKSDRTSIHIWAAGPEERRILVDWVLDRLDPLERASIILSMCQRWNPSQVIYEELGLASDTYFIRKMIRDKNLPVRWYPISVGRKGTRHLLSKESRIKLIIPLWFDHKIILPKQFLYVNSEGRKVDLTRRFIDEEFKLYKGLHSVAHEDDLDNMSRLLEPELQMRFYVDVEEKFEKHRGTRLRGQTWESVY